MFSSELRVFYPINSLITPSISFPTKVYLPSLASSLSFSLSNLFFFFSLQHQVCVCMFFCRVWLLEHGYGCREYGRICKAQEGQHLDIDTYVHSSIYLALSILSFMASSSYCNTTLNNVFFSSFLSFHRFYFVVKQKFHITMIVIVVESCSIQVLRQVKHVWSYIWSLTTCCKHVGYCFGMICDQCLVKHVFFFCCLNCY